MTIRERVLASRLIQKIDCNDDYARQIGLSYMVSAVDAQKRDSNSVPKKEKKN